MTQQTAGTSSGGLTNGAGVRIAPGGVFWVPFPSPIGRHFAVVTAVKGPYVAVVYAESNPANGKQWVIDPNTMQGKMEAYRFDGHLKRVSHFRHDTVALVHFSLIGEHIGTALQVPTVNELKKVEQAALVLSTVIDLRSQVVQLPKPPPTPSPKAPQGGSAPQ